MNLKMLFQKLKVFFLVILIILVITTLPRLLNLIIDYQWFKEVGFQSVFLKTLLAKFFIGLAAFLLVFPFTFITLKITSKFKPSVKVENDGIIDIGDSKKNNLLFLLPSFFLGLFAAYISSTVLWEDILLFLNQVPFNITEPVFNRDISFYFFSLSLLESIYSLVILFLFIIAILNLFFTLYIQGLGNQPLKTVIKRLGYFIITFFLLLIIGYQLKLANLVYSAQGAVYGAGFTDLMVTRPYYYIASLACLLAAISMFLGLKKSNFKIAASGPLLLLAIIIVGNLSQTIVQNFIVKPDEINKEQNYIARNINMTNQAFGLDKIKQIDFPAATNLDFQDLEQNKETINNIRINDFRPAQTIFNQLQGMRPYYRFPDVDVDRYYLNGQLTQVFLASREIDQNLLQPQAQTWINKYLKYTHGYGAVVIPVNEVTPQGLPNLWVKDFPPVSVFPELEITRPEIYFGEMTNDFVIVNSTEKEFNYPIGDDNAESTYEGSAGIRLNWLNRFLFAAKEGSPRIMVSGAVTNESKILLYRNIHERVKKIAPFLIYDPDAYLVISEGKLYWLIDAYTVSNKYPYSEPVNTENWYRGINYIRNPIKVVIDAYNGTTKYYLIDETEPIAVSYAKIFPELFQPLHQMPEDLRKHLRYPVDLFTIQALVYRDYHMQNPAVFYNREDAWNFAREIYENQTQQVEPYYINMKLPGSDKLEFLLMQPYTPVNKDNLIAWLAAKNDEENYGELILFQFPKQKLVYGPMQIESRISQDSEISKELNLWDQRGSSVIRGNLLVIPIEDSLLYIEPIYIKAANENSLPEVKRIIVAYNDEIVMEETLEESLYQIFSKTGATIDREQDQTEPSDLSLKILTRQAREAFDKAKQAAQAGDWAGYGEALKELENLILQLEEKSNLNTQEQTTAEETTLPLENNET